MSHRLMRSLRVRIVTAVVLLTAVTSGLMMAAHHELTRSRIEAETLQQVRDFTLQRAVPVGVALGRLRGDAAMLATLMPVLGSSQVPGGAARAMRPMLAGLLARRPAYRQLRIIPIGGPGPELVMTQPGEQATAAAGRADGRAMARERAQRIARLGAMVAAGGTVYGPYFDNGPDGRPIIALLVPVAATAGRPRAAVEILADPQVLFAPRPGQNLAAGMRFDIIDGAGRTFAQPGGLQPATVRGGDTAPRPAILPPGLTLSHDTISYRVAAPDPAGGPPLGYDVVLGVPRLASERIIRSALGNEAALAAVLIALSSVAAWRLALGLTRRLAQLRATIEDAAAGRSRPGELEALETDQDEVGALARGFAALENGLLRETARQQAIYQSAPLGILMIDGASRIETVNGLGAAMFGYGPEDLLGQPLAMLMPPGDAERHQDYVAGSRVGPGVLRMAEGRQLEGLRRDGSRFPIEVFVSRSEYSGATHYVGIVEDVTAKRLMQHQRDGLLAALARSNEELDQFAYIASHDLKAPLRVIGNAARWLEEDLETHLTDDTRETLDLMTSRVRRMERLLDALLEHSRIGRIRPGGTEISGAELAEDIRAMVDRPEGFDLAFTPEFFDIHLPRLPIATVLINLVSNAFRHHDRATGRVDVSVVVRPECFVFSVSDDGPGIPPAYHEKVFEMFQTLRPRDQVEGSGMGLAMVRKYVQVAGGTIALESDGGRGTVFRVTWPRAVQDVADAAEDGALPALAGRAGAELPAPEARDRQTGRIESPEDMSDVGLDGGSDGPGRRCPPGEPAAGPPTSLQAGVGDAMAVAPEGDAARPAVPRRPGRGRGPGAAEIGDDLGLRPGGGGPVQEARVEADPDPKEAA